MKKRAEQISGTKIIKVRIGKNGDDILLKKPLEKVAKIEQLGKALKNVFKI